ncbi:MAG: electron transfer flavoprotein subunit alpha/FixB family protein, partial [Bacteroidota bacterium]
MSVLVYTENWEGQFKKKTFELVSYARALADQLSTSVTAISIGKVEDSELEKLGTCGAAKVKHIETGLDTLDNQLYAKTIANAAEEENSGVVVFMDNFTGKALAPRVSAKLKAGFAGGVFALPESFEPFIIKSKVFSGKAFGKVKINSEKKVLALQTNSFEIAENPTDITI